MTRLRAKYTSPAHALRGWLTYAATMVAIYARYIARIPRNLLTLVRATPCKPR